MFSNTVNKRYEIEGRFRAVTADMCFYKPKADVIINTSCEHITQYQYDTWLSNQPDTAVFALQSNNYFTHEEHVRCAIDLDDFAKMSGISPWLRRALDTPKYERYMLIGKTK